MLNFLISNTFQCIVMPLFTTVLTIGIRIISRPDRMPPLDRNTFNVGINLCVTASFILATKSIMLAKAMLANAVDVADGMDILLRFCVQFFLMVIGMFALGYYIRRYGWEGYRYESPTIDILKGVIIPDLVGILYLVYVYNQQVQGL